MTEPAKPLARARLEPEMEKAWKAFLKRKGMSQQDAVERTIAWLIQQDDLVTSLVLGQIADPKRRRQVVEILLKELAGKKRAD